MTYTYDYPHPAVTVDVVIFTIVDDEFKVLLIQRGIEPYERMWALPGGFVGVDESLRRAAWRELKEETGVHAAFLEQLSAFDHAKILRRAHQKVKDKIDEPIIALQLVPESFTLSDLQRVHERILGTSLDKRNFRKKILALDLLTPTGEERRDGPHRPAKLYRVKDPSDVPYR
jgi:8-oxo-dGTP diphosphatase